MEAFNWEIIALLTAILAAIFNGCGLFTTEWWIGDGVKYGLFTRVVCQGNLCVIPTDDSSTSDWIKFARVSALVQFILILAAILGIVGHLCCKKPPIIVFSIAALCSSGFFAVLHVFTIVSIYLRITWATRTWPLPENHVFYQTLPVGLNAIAGTMCVPAFIGLVIRNTKKRRELLEGSKKNKRNVVV